MKIKDDTFNPIKAGGGAMSTPLRPNQTLQNMGLREIPTYVYVYSYTLHSTGDGENGEGDIFLRLIGLIAQK